MPEVNLWNKALDILSRREHSISQLKSKIQKFQDNEEQIEELINKLIDKNLVNNFYIQAENLLIKLIDDSRLNIFIKDCIKFNRETLKKPMINKDKNISLNCNIPILYQKSLIGKPFLIGISKTS